MFQLRFTEVDFFKYMLAIGLIFVPQILVYLVRICRDCADERESEFTLKRVKNNGSQQSIEGRIDF